MLRLEPTSSGGFYIFNDYIGDAGAGIFGGFVFIIYLIAIINPFVNNPGAFGGAFASLIIGLAIVLFIGSMDGLFFIRPLALPFLCYALASMGIAMVENVSASMGLLMLVAVPFMMLVMNIAIFGLVFFNVEIAVIPIAINFLVMSYASFLGSNSGALFYLMRVIDIGSIITMVVLLVSQIRAKQKLEKTSIVANLALMAMGFVGLIAFVIITSIFKFNYSLVMSAILVGACLVTFIVLTILARNLLIPKNSKLQGGFEALVFALFIAAAFLFAMNAHDNVGDEIIGGIISSLKMMPLGTHLAATIYNLSMAFGDVLGAILSFIINLIFMIFDGSINRFIIPYPIAYVLMIVIINVVISLTLRIINK